ncbi:MAG: type VI secretion system baseplate subunit TssE [Pseudomonadota bacterium]
MAHLFSAGFLDRLLWSSEAAARNPNLTLAQYKSSVARDLESLLNTRTAFPQANLSQFPESANSILNYGLRDFSNLCLSNIADRETICSAVKAAIERHESRLSSVSASLRVASGSSCRVEFVITALLQTEVAGEPVQFDAQLDSATQQYSILTSQANEKADAA